MINLFLAKLKGVPLKQLLIVFVLLFSINSLAEFKNGFRLTSALAWGYDFKNTVSSLTYEEGDKIFGGLGLGFGYTPRYEFGNFSLGLNFIYEWKEEAMKEKSSSGDTDNFDFQYIRFMGGVHFEYKLAESIGLVFEYTPYINANIHWSDDGSENPFRKGDNLSGNAIAAGLGFHWGPVDVFFMYRQITWDKIETNTVSRDLPGSTYSAFKSNEVTSQLGITF